MQLLSEYLSTKFCQNLLSYHQVILEDYDLMKRIDMLHPLRILENSNSLYKGQYELAEFLTMQVLLKHSDNCEIEFSKDKLKKFNNVFFDKIQIIYKKSKQIGGYKIVDNKIIITINSSEIKRYESIFSTISHELKHAWQDYKEDYNENSPSNISSTKQYKDITNKLTNSDLNVAGAANYAYHIYKMEQDAFASEFATALKIEINKYHPKDIQECIKLAGGIDVFADLSRYKEIFYILSTHNSIGNLTKEGLLNELYKIKNKRYDWNQFYHVFVRKIEKLFNKLCNIVANMYFEYEENK